jgi:hypothetical protein
MQLVIFLPPPKTPNMPLPPNLRRPRLYRATVSHHQSIRPPPHRHFEWPVPTLSGSRSMLFLSRLLLQTSRPARRELCAIPQIPRDEFSLRLFACVFCDRRSRPCRNEISPHHLFLTPAFRGTYLPSGTCEEIDSRNFHAIQNIQALQTPLICVLSDKFLSADFMEIANMKFFTPSCPICPSYGLQLGYGYVEDR